MTIPTVLQVAARRPGRPTDERRHNYVIRANTRSQPRRNLKGEGYKRWFITGTDTNVGKTIVSCALLQAAKLAGYQSVGYKPVASGSLMTSAGICNPDGLALQANSCNKALDYQQINPFAFIEATSTPYC